MKINNIVLTGLPRSGTTLVCHLLNKVQNTIALHEPMSVSFSQHGSPVSICDEIAVFFNDTRHTILKNGTALSLHLNNKIPDNHIGNIKNDVGLRTKVKGVVRGMINIDKDLTTDFNLCIKHNAIFTLLLKHLAQRFTCYAIVRNPLSLLSSWNSVNLPINNGHIPMAEKQDRVLSEKLKITPDKIDRQIIIMSWFFDHFSNLPTSNIIWYEKVISTGGSTLVNLFPDAGFLDEPLKNKNINSLYDLKLMKELGKRLLNSDGKFWHFYSRTDVENLLMRID